MRTVLATALMTLVAAFALPLGKSAAAQHPECTRLSPEQLSRAKGLMARIYPHDCCDDTLAACLEKNPCRLVDSLAGDVCRRVADKQDDAEILRLIEQRGASMLGTGKPAEIDLSANEVAGEGNAPVTVVVYACARCPFCSKSVPAIYQEVTAGSLKGKARLAMRVFPVKSHEYSKEGGLALVAAQKLGRFWPYLLLLYKSFDEFCVGRLSGWATDVGLDEAVFGAEMKKGTTTKALVDSKKEGLRNQVEATPTYFINGKLYKGDLKNLALREAIEEEFDRVSGTLCKPR
jgi:protein-disulfide isomerase